MKRHHKIGLYVIFILLLAILAVVYQKFLLKGITPETIKNYILGWGALAPIAFITILILLGIISVLPNTPFIIASGYVFGTWLGALYGFIGIMAGSSIVFALAKAYGKPFVKKIVDNEELRQFDAFFEKKGVYSLFIMRLIPMFPADIASFATGLTGMKYREYMLITAATIAPPLIMQNFFGSILAKIREINVLLMVIAVVLGILLIISYTLRGRLKQIFIKELKIVGKDAKKAERAAKKEIKIMIDEVSIKKEANIKKKEKNGQSHGKKAGVKK